jgi:DNA-binding NarL/FixJ family response regulator
MIRILIADDHEVVRRGLRDLVDAQTGWDACGEARNGHEAVALATWLRPDVAILDLSLPALNGIDAARRIRADAPATSVLLYTVHASESLAREALAAGALGYVVKSDPIERLVTAVESVAAGSQFVSPGISRAQPGKEPGGRMSARRSGRLTPREREIAQLLAEGKSNWSISRILGISEKTVENHRGNIMHKLRLESIVELVHYAARNHLIAL